MRLVLALILILLPANAFAEGFTPYYVPPGQFNASLQIMQLGLSNIIGLFSNATASFSFNEHDKSVRNLKLALDTTSLVTNNAQSVNALGTLLAIPQNPEIRFTSLETTSFTDGKGSVKGTLTVHGVSKPFTFDATLNTVKGEHSGGVWDSLNEAAGLSLHGTFKRADFGMTDDPNVVSEFGDTITLQLEMQAIKQ